MEKLIPRNFFNKKFEDWTSKGYQVIDFTKAEVDLSELPEYYEEKFSTTERKIEKNYLLNHLIYHNLVYYTKVLNRYIFKNIDPPLNKFNIDEIPLKTEAAHHH